MAHKSLSVMHIHILHQNLSLSAKLRLLENDLFRLREICSLHKFKSKFSLEYVAAITREYFVWIVIKFKFIEA